MRPSSTRQALSRVTFSRSSRPMRPSRCGGVIATSGRPRGDIAAAILAGVQEARRPLQCQPIDPRVANSSGRVTHCCFIERHERPAVVLVAALEHQRPRLHLGPQVGRPVDEGGSEAPPPAGRRGRRRHGHVAPLHDGVGEMRGADHDRVDATARGRPPFQSVGAGCAPCRSSRSAVVGAFTAPATLPSSSSTASVLVPPTSSRMPFLREDRLEIEVVAEGARADVLQAFGVVRMAGAVARLP